MITLTQAGQLTREAVADAAYAINQKPDRYTRARAFVAGIAARDEVAASSDIYLAAYRAAASYLRANPRPECWACGASHLALDQSKRCWKCASLNIH
jgi:hypothetical protein